jgi:DNA polymerase-3 subunit epsilon
MIERTTVFIDTETTGLPTKTSWPRIIEIYGTKIVPGERPVTFHALVDPEMEIEEGATAVHGITNDQVKGARTFSKIAPLLTRFLDGAEVIVGHNLLKFDAPVLVAEFKRVGAENPFKAVKLEDTMFTAKKLIRFSQEGLISLLGGKAHKTKHRAESDVEDLMSLYMLLSERFGRDKMEEHIKSPENIAGYEITDTAYCLDFGLHEGSSIAELLKTDKGKSYLKWCHNTPRVNFLLHSSLLEKCSD